MLFLVEPQERPRLIIQNKIVLNTTILSLTKKYNEIFEIRFMTKLKKIFLATLFGFSILIPVGSQAVDIKSQLGAAAKTGAGYEEPLSNDPRVVLTNGIKIFLSFLGTLFLVMTLYAGFTIMTAAGEEEKVEKGKKTLVRSAIGIAVVMSAYSITLLAYKIATGDAQHQGSYVEIKNQDVDFQRGNVPHADSVGCPYGLEKQPDGSCGSYSN